MAKNNDEISKNVKNYANKPRAENRREADYGITDDDWLKDILHRGAFGSLATSLNDQPFITPMLYLYNEEDHAIYLHTARAGRAFANAHLNPNVCFNISEFGRFLPHQDAVDFNVEYDSITIFGIVSIIDNDQDAKHYLQLMLDKYAPHLKPDKDYNEIQQEEINRTAVYKIDIQEWSGKQQIEDDGYPGAFTYPHPTP